ncbi:nondiscriminating aspartyl-tRNA synthetase [Bacillus pakistanensis]|uniref:Aspartate--tRNA ligase n=1 Tax=Rossellomorea pakistanensis TaxID=992288 RepID=A0ABS2N842_9BACI|nr:aspartate--tRNA(Asn) ligase [Bacillus pakistanensis]MBM7583766.1 nondiscriminating aspartyl-tRNA synthetase [Bacillus pakistanensis]
MDEYQRVLTSECSNHVNEDVNLKGWVHRVRHLRKVSFLILKDRSGFIQCVLESKIAKMKITNESAVEISGKVVSTNQQENGVEIHVDNIKMLSYAAPIPFEVNNDEIEANLDTILNHRVLSMRNPKVQSIFRIQSKIVESFQEYLRNKGFTQIFTPKLTSQGAEGGANVFSLPYFGKEAYLAQSPQFYKQKMVAAGYERVFEVAPVFRAEEHNSSRHLNEYTSMDVEVGFIEGYEELMKLENQLLIHIFEKVKLACANELKLLNIELPELKEFPQLTLQEAQQILKEQFEKTSPDGDLDREGEKLISQYIEKKYLTPFVFITNYPTRKRPMYTMLNQNNTELTDSFDLIYKGVEITSGGQRIHDYQQLIKSLASKGLDLDNFKSYTDLFRFGFPPHGGFAIGLERLTAQMLNINNVREATAFPRDCDRLTP